MSILQAAARERAAANTEATGRAREFVQLARALAMGGPTGLSNALRVAEGNRASPRVVEILKSAVAAGTTDNLSQLVDYQSVAAGFLETLARNSAIEAIRVAGGWRALPLNTRIGAVTVGLSGTLVLEADTKVISRLTLTDNGVLTPIKVAVITVLTNELVRFSGAVGQQLMANELRVGLGKAVDLVGFDALLISGIANTASAGTSAANAWTDLKYLIDAVDLNAASKPFFVGAVDALKAFATRNASGVAAFPTLAPTGGTLLGIPVLPSDGLTAGTLALIDANQVAVGDDGVALSQSTQANVQLDDAPSDPPANPVNLWQQNMVALRAERRFALQALASSALAYVTGVA